MTKTFRGSAEAEHRRFPRAKIKLSIHFNLLDGATVSGDFASTTEDLGAGGIAMRCTQKVPPGQHLMLTLYLPKKENRMTGQHNLLIYPEDECQGVFVFSRVAWTQETENHDYIIGIKFLAPEKDHLGYLKEFLVDYHLDNPESYLFT